LRPYRNIRYYVITKIPTTTKIVLVIEIH
jgi:hypothetical protein